MRTCVICGKEFPPRTQAKTCSPECSKENYRRKQAEYSKKHSAVRSQRARQWALDHPERTKKRRREWEQSRKNSDPRYALDSYMSKSLTQALRRPELGGRWQTLVPYNGYQLRAHIESTMQEGMTWANYGTAWDIDHITPKIDYEYTDSSDPAFNECWSLDNLRAQWASVNRSSVRRRRKSVA